MANEPNILSVEELITELAEQVAERKRARLTKNQRAAITFIEGRLASARQELANGNDHVFVQMGSINGALAVLAWWQEETHAAAR